MDQQKCLSENTIIFAAYLSGEDDSEKKGDILMDARRRFFTTRKRTKDKVFFTAGIDSVRCRYQIDASKPMKWLKEVNGKTSQVSIPDSSGSYTVVCTDMSGDVTKKLYFSNANIWQKSEYYSHGAVNVTLTACRADNGLSIAVQYPGKPAQVLTAYSDKSDAETETVVTAQTSNGEFFFSVPVEEALTKNNTSAEDNINRKGFFFDASLIYGDFTTLNIKKGETKQAAAADNDEAAEIISESIEETDEKIQSLFEEQEEEKTKIADDDIEDNEASDKAADDDLSSDSSDMEQVTSPDKIIENSSNEKYYYFGSLSKTGIRNGSGVTLTPKGSVIYCGGYENDNRSGFGAQFFKNGKISHVGKWSDDKKNGFGIAFLSDGTISAGGYENDRKKSASARFDSDGNLSSVLCYKNDEPHGAAINVDRENNRIFIQKCDSGKIKNPATVLDMSGNIIYNGEMSDGKFNGSGRLFDKNGTLKYSGEFKNGLYNGTGTLYLDDNSFVSGEFLNGQIKGEAVHRLSNGTLLYKGGFKDGEYNGKGTIYKSDGSFYSTTFENGIEKGAISVYAKSGELLYKGSLKNGEYSGKGTLYSGGTKVYEGGFADGKKSGMGRSYSDNLCEYMGNFESDKRCGFGVSYKNNSAVYTGFWLDDKYDGQGVLHNADNNLYYAGTFKNGVMCGRINILDGKRLVKECIYENGKATYMREYDENGCVVYEGSSSDGVREGMGCAYSEYGEKQFEGIFKYGEPYKAMRVIPKSIPQLDYCDKLKDTVYHSYIVPPEFVSEQLIGSGIYSGSLNNGKPNGCGTMLYTDHRYTGSFKNGKPGGFGILYFGDGKELKGEFVQKPSEDTQSVRFADAVYYVIADGEEA